MKREATAVWRGDGPNGSGELSTQSGALKGLPYSANWRFQNEDGKAGTNPEELIGAAHAGCFSMALAFALGREGLKADELRTSAKVDLQKGDAGWSIKGIELTLQARIPGISPEKFQELAQGAKAGCPVSRALGAVPITLNATLA
ncbi:MAG TPA: OsmC family protein [Burkholderiaceae bacterium]|nr:OsmC family protein [Burkholderiaceae bacterium]